MVEYPKQVLRRYWSRYREWQAAVEALKAGEITWAEFEARGWPAYVYAPLYRWSAKHPPT